MLATRQRGTAAEMAVRKAVHRLGLRYRVDAGPLSTLRRRADLVFPAVRVVVFVDGCFWHGCPIHGTWPKRNAEWWREKIEGNKRRDLDTDERLAQMGWAVVRVWAHEPPGQAAQKIESIVTSRREPREPKS
jgi:DNA mismatch endonuclease (patch repair protein)